MKSTFEYLYRLVRAPGPALLRPYQPLSTDFVTKCNLKRAISDEKTGRSRKTSSLIKAQTRPKTGQTWTNKNKQEGKHNLIHPIKLFFNQNFSKMSFSSNFEVLQWNRTLTIHDFDKTYKLLLSKGSLSYANSELIMTFLNSKKHHILPNSMMVTIQMKIQISKKWIWILTIILMINLSLMKALIISD